MGPLNPVSFRCFCRCSRYLDGEKWPRQSSRKQDPRASTNSRSGIETLETTTAIMYPYTNDTKKRQTTYRGTLKEGRSTLDEPQVAASTVLHTGIPGIPVQ